MYVVIRTNDEGRISTVDTTVYMREYAACRVLDDVHARYELLDSAGMLRAERVTDRLLIVTTDAGDIRYEISAIEAPHN